MFIPELQQHLQVFSRENAERATRVEKRFWNVVSIRSAAESQPQFPEARRVHFARFDDVDESFDRSLYLHARPEELEGIYGFIETVGTEPLLTHCQMGISRSTAIMLAHVYYRLAGHPERERLSAEILLRLQPRADPNTLVLKLGLARFMVPNEHRSITTSLLRHLELLRNR